MRRSASEEARRWLDQAREDLKWVGVLTEAGGHHVACFLAQQVAEKAIKAFLYAQGESPVLGHSVAALAQKAAQYSSEIAQKSRSWAILDSYYIPTRYPNGLPDSIPAYVYNSQASTGALRLAADAVNTVAAILNEVPGTGCA